MDLQNGYKVIYEHRVIEEELERHLKATKTIPAEADVNLTYKDGSTTITPEELKAFKLVYEKEGNLFGSTNGKVNADDRKILVYSGNDLLIGKVENAPVMAAPVVVEEPVAEVVEEAKPVEKQSKKKAR